jgi:hypothetical protein
MAADGEPMIEGGLPSRYDLIECEVVGHQHYGVLFRTVAGRPGYIDLADVYDEPWRRDWPPVGALLKCVVLGLTSDGRIRAASCESLVGLVEEVPDPGQALSEWVGVRDVLASSPEERDAFFASRDAAAVLRWAKRQREISPDRHRALEILEMAPDSLRHDVERG